MASVAVVFWFEWTNFGHSEIVCLFLVQFGEFDTQLFQMGCRHLFVQLENQIRGGRRESDRRGEKGERARENKREEVEKERGSRERERK